MTRSKSRRGELFRKERGREERETPRERGGKG